MAVRKSILVQGFIAALAAATSVGACGGGGAANDAGGTHGTGGAAATTGAGGGGGKGGGGGSSLPPPICNGGTKWVAGAKAFEEATSDWALDKIGAQGTRIDAVDFDGDGWTDLVIRMGGAGTDDFVRGGVRWSWLLRNTGKGTFEDVTQSSGFRRNRTDAEPKRGRPGEVIAFADLDNDGDLDAYTGFSYDAKQPTLETSEIVLNDGHGHFSLGPADSPVRLGKKDVPCGASFVDFDRDGKVDLWVPQNALNYAPQQDHLYKGDGTGALVDVTTAMGLRTKSWTSDPTPLNQGLGNSYGWSATTVDLDNDGNPELLAASYGRAPNALWKSKGASGGFQFLNSAVASGYAFDGNMDWSDNESARCWCKLHPSDDQCPGVPPPKYISCNVDADAFRWNHATDRQAYRLGGNSGAALVGDVDNDGDMDIVTAEIAHWDVGQSSDKAELLLNDGTADVHFTRPGNDVTGLARKHEIPWDEGIMTGSLFDFDNDGALDLYWGNSDYPGNYGLLFHQDSPLTPGKAPHFEAVPIALGVDNHRSHGSAVADFDHDGDLDIVVGHSHARCDADCYPTQQIRLFRNLAGQGGNFVELKLTGGPGTNRAAIGARVTVKAGGLTMMRDVGGGFGHYGAQDDLTVHFGLGAACEADVTVRWPDAALTTQSFKLPAGYRFAVVQGEDPKVD